MGRAVCRSDRPLVVELDQDHRAVDSIVKDAVGRGAADPGECGRADMLLHLAQFHRRVAIAHVADIHTDQRLQPLPLRRAELGRRNSGG